MAEKTITMAEWQARADRLSPNRPFRMNGPSPGGAAVELDVSRQAVHQMIRDDRLDAWRIVADHQSDRLLAIIITGESLDRLKAERKLKGLAVA